MQGSLTQVALVQGFDSRFAALQGRILKVSAAAQRARAHAQPPLWREPQAITASGMAGVRPAAVPDKAASRLL